MPSKRTIGILATVVGLVWGLVEALGKVKSFVEAPETAKYLVEVASRMASPQSSFCCFYA
jgi:hypothetical protein